MAKSATALKKAERERRERQREREAQRRRETREALNPDFVPLPEGLVLLGGMSRSRAYELAGLGLIDFFKDGARTIVSTESINRYLRSLARAKITTRPSKRGEA